MQHADTYERAEGTLPVCLPGVKFNLMLWQRWKDPNDPRNHASPMRSAGFYKATLAFSRSGGPLGDVTQPATPGDSFIVIPHTDLPRDSKLRFVYDEGDQRIELDAYANDRGRLAGVVAQNIYASTFDDAESKALRAASGLLSQLSLRFNVPIIIAAVKTTEIATGNLMRTFVSPHIDVKLDLDLGGKSSRDFRFYAGLYREALNSNSPIYKFLCFYKIIEGLLKRRERIASECKKRGEKPKRYSEVVQATPAERRAWLTSLFDMPPDWDDGGVVPKEAEGKKFQQVIDKYLRRIRVGIAHAVLDNGELALTADEAWHITYVHYWLVLTQCIARQVLKNDFPDEFGDPAEPEIRT